MSFRRVIRRRWRLRAEAWERPIGPIRIQQENQPNGTITMDSAAAKTGDLLKTFWVAAEFSIKFIVIFLFYIRFLSWLSVIEWSQTRCQLLSPSSLKMADLRSLLNERGISQTEQLSKQELEAAVLETGGVMEIEMESFLGAVDNINNSQLAALRFETWKAYDESIQRQSVGVYLVLCSTELERRTSELKRWRQFLHRLSKHGVKFIFLRCDNDGDCDTPKVTLLLISNPKGYNSWSAFYYKGPLRPSDILQWITELVSQNVHKVRSTTHVFKDLYRSSHSAVAHSTRPLPLSYAVLASEFSGRVSFFWVETLDQYIRNRASLIVTSPGGSLAYHKSQFLNQKEIRYLLTLSTMDDLDFMYFIFLFSCLVAVTIPLTAGASLWQRVKSMVLFLLLCALAICLLVALERLFDKGWHDEMRFLAASLATLIKPIRGDMLLAFHLFDEYPWVNLVVPVVYVLEAVYSLRVYQFFRSDVLAFVIRLFTASPKASESSTATPVTPLSTKTLNQAHLDVAGTKVHIFSDATKPTTKVPLNAAKTTAKIAYNVTKTAIQVPSNAAMATGGADGRNDSHTDDPASSNRKVIAVTQSRSLERQNLSLSAGFHPQDPAAPTSSSNGTMPAYSTTRPFEYPPLMDSANGVLDRATAEQMTRLNIPKVWLRPIISDGELKLAVLALQRSEARDQRSFEPASRIVPCCFYCGTDFRPTSGVIVLPCRDIFHPGCVDEWMKAGNIDCPLCQMPIYATMSRTIA